MSPKLVSRSCHAILFLKCYLGLCRYNFNRECVFQVQIEICQNSIVSIDFSFSARKQFNRKMVFLHFQNSIAYFSKFNRKMFEKSIAFVSFVSQFFSLSPRLGACGRGFAAGLSPTSFHLSPTSFHLSFHLSPTSYHLSPRLGACGRVSGWLISHFLSYVSHFFSFVSLGACGRVCGWLVSHVLSFVSHFFHLSSSSFHLSPTSFHSPSSLLLGVLNALKNGRLGAGWSGRVPSRLVSHFLCLPVLFSRGSRLACLPLPFICLPILFICLRHFLSFVSHCFSLSPRLGACGRVPGRLVSHFLSFVSHFFSFVSQAGCLWSGSRPACLPLPFICLPLLFCLWSGSRPACFHLSPGSFHLSPRNASFVSQVRHCWCHVAFLFICLCHC